jgi:opacity protein-like surface antigen
VIFAKRSGRRAAAATAWALAAFLMPSPVEAGEFYGAVGLAITEARSDASGNNGVVSPTPNSGSPSDTSPLVAGTLGFEFRMHELRPRGRRSPAWMPDLDLEDWVLRTEIEAAGARSYDLDAQSNDPDFPHRARVEDVTLMLNQWLDLPLGHAIEAVAGRVRGIEDLTFDLGLGAGYIRRNIETGNGVSFGETAKNGFVWQAGVDLGYPLSDNVVLTGGYRYVALGNHETGLTDSTGTQNNGVLKLDVDSHEFRAAIRVRFYSIRFPRGLLEPKRRYEP